LLEGCATLTGMFCFIWPNFNLKVAKNPTNLTLMETHGAVTCWLPSALPREGMGHKHTAKKMPSRHCTFPNVVICVKSILCNTIN